MNTPTDRDQTVPSTVQSPSRPRRWRRWLVIAALLAFPGWWLYRGLYPPPLRVSPETTVITSPLLPDGRPDYVAYLNQKYSEGVTPENNAAVILARVAGGSSIDEHIREKFFAWLRVPVPGDEERLMPWHEYAAKAGVDDSRKELLESAITGFWFHGMGRADMEFDPQQHSELTAYLDAQQVSLDLLVTGLQRERYFTPLLAPPEFGLGVGWEPALGQGKDWHYLLARRCRLHLHRGQTEAAVRDALALLRLSRHVRSLGLGDGSYLGVEIEGLECCEELVLSSRLSLEDIARLQRGLAQLPPVPSAATTLDLGCRLTALDFICRIPGSKAQEITFGNQGVKMPEYRLRFGTEVNRLLTTINSSMDELCRAARIEDFRERRETVDEITGVWYERRSTLVSQIFEKLRDLSDDDLESLPTVRVGEREVFELLCSSSRYPLGRGADTVEIRFTLLKVALELAEFRLIHGNFPASLEELVPEQLAEVPRDPFGTGPFRYTRHAAAWTLWSVGENGDDEAGLFGDIWLGRDPRGPPFNETSGSGGVDP